MGDNCKDKSTFWKDSPHSKLITWIWQFVYTPWVKKVDVILLSISLLNIDRFSQFFHRRTELELCNKIINKDPTSPQMCCTLPCEMLNKKAQLSLTNPRDAKTCQKLLQFDVLTTLSLTILVYLHSFCSCCVRDLRNPAKFTENSNLWSSRSSKVIDLGVNWKPMYDFLLVTNSNFGRICYRFRDIDA